jgi:3-hydroxyisobutyrate dehydrogenase
MKIGIAGLGAMGANIAARLMDVGHDVSVWNRSPEKMKPLAEAGAKVAKSPAELAGQSEVVITILTDGKAIDDVYNGANGLLSGDVKGKLFIEMSTVAPKVPTELAPKVRAKGAALVECPVGGSTAPARKGQLLGLMGAENADAKRALPILEQLCRKVEHCGPVGSGAAIKLAINLPLMVAWQAYGEAFAIARSVGWPTTFSIANAVKDLRTMVATGEALGADMRATKAALSSFEDAVEHDLGGDDGARMTVYWAARGK